MSETRRFCGFPAGARATAVPNLFFSDLLPEVDDPAELVLTAYAFFALGRRRPGERMLTVDALAAEAPLRRALARLPGGADGALRRGLDAAVRRGTLIRAETPDGARYALNSAAGRRELGAPAQAAERETVGTPATEPVSTIYALYEENIGTITPLIADELRAAEGEYPAAWVEGAFREAVSRNRRSWRYIARILERWWEEGRDDAAVGRDSQGGRDLAGRYRGIVHR